MMKPIKKLQDNQTFKFNTLFIFIPKVRHELIFKYVSMLILSI